MRIAFYVLVSGVSAAVTFGLAIVIWKLSTRYRLYPKIRERDVHTRPTPRLGGVAMFLGMLVAFLVASQLPNFSIVFSEPGKVLGVGGAALIIVLIGVADDIWDLDWLTKLAGQIIAAGILAWQGVQIATLPIGGQTIVSPYVSLILTVFAIVLVMNAINFIDGLDGLVAGVALIANGVAAYKAALGMIPMGNPWEQTNVLGPLTSQRQRDRDHGDRHVDPEDRVPREVLEQEAAGDRPEGDGHAGDGRPDAHGGDAFLGHREDVGDDRERRREDQRGERPHHRAGGDQAAEVRDERGDDRGHPEPGQAHHERAASAGPVTEVTRGEQ